MIVNRMTGKGQLEIAEDMSVTLGGQIVKTSARPIHMSAKTINGVTYTAYLDGTQIALMSAEEMALRKAQAVTTHAHMTTRREIEGQIADYRQQTIRAIEMAAQGEAMNYTASAKMADAVRRLSDYDQEHPDEIAAIRAEQDAAHKRFMAAD